jgi:hypothetical protein
MVPEEEGEWIRTRGGKRLPDVCFPSSTSSS